MLIQPHRPTSVDSVIVHLVVVVDVEVRAELGVAVVAENDWEGNGFDHQTTRRSG